MSCLFRCRIQVNSLDQRFASHCHLNRISPSNDQAGVKYGAPFSHLFTELKISPIEVHISAIQLEISPIQLEISTNRPI